MCLESVAAAITLKLQVEGLLILCSRPEKREELNDDCAAQTLFHRLPSSEAEATMRHVVAVTSADETTPALHCSQ